MGKLTNKVSKISDQQWPTARLSRSEIIRRFALFGVKAEASFASRPGVNDI
jgi:hypothetical protein